MRTTITITEKEFIQLAQYIYTNYGIRLKREKQTMVMGRLHHVLQQGGYKNFTEYYDAVLNDKTGSMVITLLNKITTNHTFFMREADHFYYFRDHVLPVLRHTVKDKDLRIWCAACSTGEEAYTLAMLVDEFFNREKMFWDTKLLATDISENVLTIAKKGVYENEKLSPLPKGWQINYFKKYDAHNAVVIDRIKQEIVYRRFNLVEPIFPFKRKFHTVFCRNVMIYFDSETKRQLVEKLYDAMEYGGYLFIGHSECLNRQDTRFKYIRPAVYRKE